MKPSDAKDTMYSRWTNDRISKGFPMRASSLWRSRILITANVRHFLPLITEMGVRGESHPGCILISRSVRSEDFGIIISGVSVLLEGTSQEDWRDRVAWLSG